MDARSAGSRFRAPGVAGGIVAAMGSRPAGVYVALFFVAAKAVNLPAFHIAPSPAILLGGALIFAGGRVMTFWH